MQNRKWGLIAFLGVLLLGILAWRFESWQQDSMPATQSESAAQRSFSQLKIGEQTFEVVLSETPAEITQGLSDRQTIGAQGMLFLLPEKRAVSFWMYRMNFPLDFVWVADGQVVDLHENVPAVPFNTPEQEIPVVAPAMAVEMVLEVPVGFIQENDIERGMRVELAPTRTLKRW